MKRYVVSAILVLMIIGSAFAQEAIISVDDLLENGSDQRRDLSIPGSRIVVNPYDFTLNPAEVSLLQYSEGKDIPLNIAVLTTHNHYSEQQRMGRVINRLLSIYQQKGSKIVSADTVLNAWTPYSLPFKALYSDNVTLSGHDFFYDENTLIRQLKSSIGSGYQIAGAIAETMQADKSAKTITISSLNVRYVIAFSNSWSNIRYYRNEADFHAQRNALSKPVKNGWWSITFAPFSDMDIAITIEEPSVAIALLQKKAKTTVQPAAVERSYADRKAYWDVFLTEKVPHPQNFSFSAIDSKGITAEDVRLAYYKAWVCIAQNVLPPDPKVYPYYQLVTGKASLWDEGEHNAPFSATWESLVAIQLYSLIDTDVAWSALKGLLSLVDETGMLGGESLPSRKAQAAWQLYEFTNDYSSLKEVYPALKRYMNWRREQPRWIYKNETPENEKDAEFVVSALADIGKMQQIAAVLKLPDDKSWWAQQEKELFADYLRWFWETPEAIPVQHINQYKGRDTYPVQITTGLFLKDLKGAHLNSMLQLFNNTYDTTRSFAGFEAPKYPDMDYTIYGLIYHQQAHQVRILIEANIRDVIRSGCFAETYFHRDNRPVPGGVRPSIFGMAQVISFVLLKNGYVFDQGVPHTTGVFLQDGGVNNIRYRDQVLGIQMYAAQRFIEVSDRSDFLLRVPVDTLQIRPVFPEGSSTAFYLQQAHQPLWYERALANEGNPLRLKSFLQKALKGDTLTIGVIGGSITAGAAAIDFNRSSYAALVYDWFQQQFPLAHFHLVNAGIGATNSVYGVHRADNDLLQFQPDLVIVEFSANDRGVTEAQESYEGLIRKILKSPSVPAVITLGLMDEQGDSWQSQHLPVSRHYQLPYISYRDALWPELTAGSINWRALSPDEVHPNDRGHAYIAGLVLQYIKDVYKSLCDAPQQELSFTEIPPPLTNNAYERSTVITPALLKADKTGDFTVDENGWRSVKAGQPLEIIVRAGSVWVNYWRTNKGDGGIAEVYVDGKKVKELNADFSGGWGDYIAAEMLMKEKNASEHRINIYFKGRPDQYFLVRSFLISNY